VETTHWVCLKYHGGCLGRNGESDWRSPVDWWGNSRVPVAVERGWRIHIYLQSA